MLTWTVQVISPVFVIVGLVCLLESIFFFEVNSWKVNYFLMFGSFMKNKLENTF